MDYLQSSLTCVTAVALASATVPAFAATVVVDGDFENPDLRLVRPGEGGVWTAFTHGESDARLSLLEGEGRGGSRCVAYTKADDGSQNIHLDQIITVEKETVYQLTAWVRGDGRLNPVLSVATMDWHQMAVAVSEAGTEWTEVRIAFHSYDNEQLRFEWFPGAEGKLYTGVAGTSHLDEVAIAKMEPVPQSLRRAFGLLRAKEGQEIDLTTVRTEPVGDPSPLRPIRCRDGVLVYGDGTEVALWGVNFQTALYWEYMCRMKPCGIPLEAEALKEIADRNLAELRRMEVGVVRMHLLPSDFSDAEGNVRESIFLDLLDYTLARCREAGVYVYLTLLNEMYHVYQEGSFIVPRDRTTRWAGRKVWLVDESYIRPAERFVRSLLERENRYSNVRYRDDDALAVIEVMNEPGYVDCDEMMSDPQFAELRGRFEEWCEAQGLADNLAAHYPTFRYEYVKEYVGRVYEAIRVTGAKQPVAWNLNWPRMIAGHEDVFQAIADSPVEVVSFCLYPGQGDVGHPFWEHPTDLSDRNYLPFLRDNYTDYHRLRWLLGERFAGKAKAVYEFETFYNQSSYLYPAMARLFRALGAQIAQMWTYSLSPTAEYLSGSHHLNLYCTPQKAVSFAVAGEVFAGTPRYAAYDIEAQEAMVEGDWAVSFEHNLSVLAARGKLMHSRSLEWCPLPVSTGVREIVACGDSELVSYDGTGAYSVWVSEHAVDITINPDAEFIRPPWGKQTQQPWERVCQLDREARHRFALHLPGWTGRASVWRIEGEKRVPVPCVGPELEFEVSPGEYRVQRANPGP